MLDDLLVVGFDLEMQREVHIGDRPQASRTPQVSGLRLSRTPPEPLARRPPHVTLEPPTRRGKAMRIRRTLALAAATAALATGLAATPAAADKSNPSPGTGKVSAAEWTPTTTLSAAPIRECYAATCDVVIRTGAGHTVYWSHYANNSSGNRWYYVKYLDGNGHPQNYYGWIYCGNVTAPC